MTDDLAAFLSLCSDEHAGHVLDENGVTETRFVRTGPTRWTNAEEITIPPGGVLQVAPGIFIANPAEPPHDGFTDALRVEL